MRDAHRSRRPPKALLTAVFVLVLVAAATAVGGWLRSALGKTDPPVPRQIALGAWTKGLYDPVTATLHPSALTAYEKLTDKKVTYAHYYFGWQYLENPVILSQFARLRANGWTPVVSVNPYFFSGCPATSVPLYRAIAEGRCDAFLRAAGANLSQLSQPVYLAFAYEMNNPVNAWSVASTGSTSADFVAAWRHIHAVFDAAGANDVVWVFDPNIPDTPRMPYNRLYPGSNYVDWLGLDGYNWGTTQSWSKWASFAGVFGGPYRTLTSLAPNKPMMIVEVNTTNKGGDKGAWYVDMLTRAVPYQFPDIRVVMFYNENRTKQENVDWRVDVTKESLRGFVQGVHSRFY